MPNLRAINTDSKRDVAFVKKLITRKHLNYLRKWQKKLRLQHCSFAIRPKKYDATELASIERVSKQKHIYVINLSTKTLASNDWHDSVVHELLHALVWELRTGKECRVLSIKAEEKLVTILSDLLGR